MIINSDNSLTFAFESSVADFSFEKKDRLIASLAVRDGVVVPVSLRDHDGQLHLEAHLPFAIKGATTWVAYDDFATRGDEAFGLWIDPFDGETKHVSYLREACVAELDAALAKAAACLDAYWDDLDGYAALAEADIEEAGEEPASDEGDSDDIFSRTDIDGMTISDFFRAAAAIGGV
ncbi:MAG: hypothetical protein IJO87_01905 [Eggerthellaceae bacterium]|nr:hypothetical protein [Eggerthellaceae bacterium]